MKKKTLVIGASTNPVRYSNMAIKKLVNKQQPVVALGLREGEVEGIKIEKEKIIFSDIDTVTLYVGPRNQPEYYEYLVALNPKRVIFNPGTENPELYAVLKQNNIEFQNACTLVMLGTNQY